MDSWAEEVLAMARRLSREDRLRLADALREDHDTLSGELSPAWTDEVVRRVEAFERGELPTVDGEEVFRRLRAKYGG